MFRFTIVIAVCCILGHLASADAPKIDRSIAKEPVYQTKAPKYGLLVFGPEGKDRVWLVHDGDTLYVDRNGNGDLTEKGEKIVKKKGDTKDSEDGRFSFEVGDLTVGGRVHKGLCVYFEPLKSYEVPEVKTALAKDPNFLAATIHVDVDIPGMKGLGIGGRVHYSAGAFDLTGVFQFAEKPAAAPVVHLGGPLQVTFYGELPTLRVGRDTELVLVVGTPGIGGGTFAMVYYDETIPENAKPVAEIILPPTRPGDAREKLSLELKSRC